MSYGGTSGGSGSIHASSDVALSNPLDGQVLAYNGALAKWQNDDAGLQTTLIMPLPSGDTSGATDTANLTSIQAKLPAGVGSITWGSGTYWLRGNTGTIPSYQHWYGQGQGATILKLAANQNANFIQTAGFATFNGSGSSLNTISVTGATTTAGSTTVSASSFVGVSVGNSVAGSGATSSSIVSGTIVVAVTSTTITLSNAVVYSQAGSATLSFSAVPMGWGLHHLTLDGNGFNGSANTGNRLARPTGLSVTPTGATGSTTYTYMVSALNAIGETIASTEAMITNGTSGLSGTNYNALTWNTVSGATSYNLYRGSSTLTERFLANVSTNSYSDTGAVSTTAPYFPITDTTGGRVLATYGYSFIVEDVEIRNGASCGWDSQGPSTTPFMYNVNYNGLVQAVNIHGNYGGNRLYGPTDGQYDELNIFQNGPGASSNTTNGGSNLDIGTSGISVSNFHFYGGMAQFGLRVCGSNTIFNGGAIEDGAAYLLLMMGNLNFIDNTAMYWTPSLGSSTVAIFSNGKTNRISATVANVPSGLLYLGPAAAYSSYDLVANYYQNTPPASTLLGVPVDATSRMSLLVTNQYNSNSIADMRSLIDTSTKSTITSARAGVPRSGELLTTSYASLGSVTLAASNLNVLGFAPIDVASFNGQIFTGLALNLVAPWSGGTNVAFLIGLYPDDGTGTRPSGQRLTAFDATITSANQVAGIVNVPFTAPQRLMPGRYWAASALTYTSAPSTYPTIAYGRPITNVISPSSANWTDGSTSGWMQTISGSPASLPTLPSVTTGYSYVPLIALVAQ